MLRLNIDFNKLVKNLLADTKYNIYITPIK
jgi:hypothetical protein